MIKTINMRSHLTKSTMHLLETLLQPDTMGESRGFQNCVGILKKEILKYLI